MITPLVSYTLKTAALMWNMMLSVVGCFVFLHGHLMISTGKQDSEPGYLLTSSAVPGSQTSSCSRACLSSSHST
jgi:hypothetical protein